MGLGLNLCLSFKGFYCCLPGPMLSLGTEASACTRITLAVSATLQMKPRVPGFQTNTRGLRENEIVHKFL